MHVDLPGGSAELADIKTLMPNHQDDYLDLRLEILDAKQQAAIDALIAQHPGTVPDPDADPPAVRLGRKDLKPVHDLVCTWMVQEVSFPGILPWDAGSRERLCAAAGLGAWNALLIALNPYFGVLNGEAGPKETPSSAPTSSSTSPDSAAAPPAA